MPLNRRWRSMDIFGSHESLNRTLPPVSSTDDNRLKPGDNHHHHNHHNNHHHNHHKENHKDPHKEHHHFFSLRNPFRPRLASGPKEDSGSGGGGGVAGLLQLSSSGGGGGGAGGYGGSGGNKEGEPPDPAANSGLMQRIVIIQRDEKGYGFTVSGDNPVFVASVKAEGAASRAGVQQGDRILKVNGTLVTNRNHLDVVKLIKSGSYVALALLGKRSTPSSTAGPVGGAGASSPASVGSPATTSPPTNIASNRDSTGGRVTAPQPVDPDKDRELQQQKINMTRSMYETAKEDFQKLQRQYVSKPSDKLHTQLLEKERTVKTLENQFKQLTGAGDEVSLTGSTSRPGSNRFSDSEHSGLEGSIPSWQKQPRHMKQGSVPSLLYRSRDEGSSKSQLSASVARSKSDAAGRRSKAASTFYVGFQGLMDSASEAKRSYFQLKRASSLPTTTSDLGSMSDSPHTSPSVSPTPNDPQRHNGQEMEDSMTSSSTQDIITIDDEDIHSEDDQANDPGPFADIKMLESRPAHMTIVLKYLISNSDPAPVLFHIISELYRNVSASSKELRKWAYEIYSTFVAQMAPLCIGVDDSIINQIDNILTTSASRADNENTLRNMFLAARHSVQQEIAEQLADFRNKRDLGMANFYGFQKLHDNMDKATEVKVAEELLIPILEAVSEDNNRVVRDRDQAIGWALATFLRSVAVGKSSHSSTLDRVQTFMMKDKRGIKFPGYKSGRAKSVKGHQFMLIHCYVTTFCNYCNRLIWGVNFQAYQCQSCEMTLHKQCVEEISETCGGKQKRRVSKLIMPVNRRISSNTTPNQSALSQLSQQMGGVKPVADATDNAGMTTQPYPREEETDLASTLYLIAGLPTGHSVKSIINRYELTSPTGPGPGLEVPGGTGRDGGGGTAAQGSAAALYDRKGADLNRSGSLNNKGERGDRPARRAKSDVDVDSDMFKAINQSGSSSASSLSNRSVESPSQSTEGVNNNSSTEAMRALQEADSDLEVEPELPQLQSVLGEDVLRKLKPKEKKRQEVINELFYTERNHLRNLKVLDLLFNRPMQQERGVKVMFELANALFPNMEEMIALHETLVKDIKVRSRTIPVKEVGDLLLKRFDGEAGEKFRKGCAEYCRNQAFALEALKKNTRKEPKLAQFLIDAESNPMCRRLQLKDLVPSQMQRLTKYPLLIDSLMKHTPSQSDEYKYLEQTHEKCKHILAYVNQAVKECENYHKLRDIQRKLDTKSIEGNSEDMLEIKNLDLSQHKLIFDGQLTWKLRGHRTVDIHLLLFDDMLVLLQKQDDKYVLKFQNTNAAQVTTTEHHRPVLQLKNVLARILASDKKSFFVVNMTDVGAQMYEFTAATSELRIKWCKLINEKVDEVKRQDVGVGGGGAGGPAMRSQSLNQAPKADKVELERSKTTRISRKNRSVRNPNVGSPSDSPPMSPPPKVSADHVEGIRRAIGSVSDDKDDEDEEGSAVSQLIQPEEVRVDSAVVAVEAQAVRSPLELLRQNSELITTALQDQERLVTEVLKVSGAQTATKLQQSEETNDPTEKGDRMGPHPRTWSTRRKSSGAGGDLDAIEDDIDQEEEDESEGVDEPAEVLVAKALRFNARCLQIISEETLTEAQQQVPLSAASLTSSSSSPSTSSTSLPVQQQQQQFAVSDEIFNPSSSSRRLSNQSQGSQSEGDSKSSGGSSTTASGGGIAPSSLATGTTTSGVAGQSPLLSPGGGRGAAPPREQLKIMAAEMNTILTKLMGAMNQGTEERHRLRQELAEAQERLSALKELQRQMTESGVVPPDRIPQYEEEDTDIPVTVPVVKADTATPSSPARKEAAESSLQPPAVAAETVEKLSSSSTPPASPLPSLEPCIEPVGVATTAAQPSEDSQCVEQLPQEQEELEAVVHHGIQETTQLEESVEALALTSSRDKVVAASKEEGGEEDEDIEEEDDDDNNEVSVKDLPLPDLNLPVEEDDQGGVSIPPPASSSLLDVVDLDDSDSDNEGCTSRGSTVTQLSTTVEDPLGEEEEEEDDEDDEEEGDVLLEEDDPLLRKLSASSLIASSLLSTALASPTDVDTEIIASSEAEGNNNKEASGSNVDSSLGDGDHLGSSSVDADTTSPIEI